MTETRKGVDAVAYCRAFEVFNDAMNNWAQEICNPLIPETKADGSPVKFGYDAKKGNLYVDGLYETKAKAVGRRILEQNATIWSPLVGQIADVRSGRMARMFIAGAFGMDAISDKNEIDDYTVSGMRQLYEACQKDSYTCSESQAAKEVVERYRKFSSRMEETPEAKAIKNPKVTQVSIATLRMILEKIGEKSAADILSKLKSHLNTGDTLTINTGMVDHDQGMIIVRGPLDFIHFGLYWESSTGGTTSCFKDITDKELCICNTAGKILYAIFVPDGDVNYKKREDYDGLIDDDLIIGLRLGIKTGVFGSREMDDLVVQARRREKARDKRSVQEQEKQKLKTVSEVVIFLDKYKKWASEHGYPSILKPTINDIDRWLLRLENGSLDERYMAATESTYSFSMLDESFRHYLKDTGEITKTSCGEEYHIKIGERQSDYTLREPGCNAKPPHKTR